MPKKIRVYELARELEMSNKDTLDLLAQLGIGAKSHSSSVVEAQADRARRKAESSGLIGSAPSSSDDESAAKPTKAKSSSAADAPASDAAPAPAPAAAESAPDTEPSSPAEPAEAPARPLVKSSGNEDAPRRLPPNVPPPPNLPPPPNMPPPSGPPAGPPSGPPAAPQRPAAQDTPPPAPAVPAPEPVVAEAPAPEAPAAQAPAPVADAPAAAAAPSPAPAPPQLPTDGKGRPLPPPPVGPDGKPVPPPPGMRGRGGKPIPPPPRSPGGKPIPPPPSGPRRSPGGGPGGASRGPRPGGGPGGPPRGPRPGGGPGGPPGGRPGPGGGPPGGGRGPGGRGGPPRRGRKPSRKGRRRNTEELQPQELPTYTPVDAPVPSGQIVVERGSTAQDMAPKFNRSAADVVRFLMQNGEMVTATQSLSDDMIELFSEELGAELRLVNPGEEQEVGLREQLGAVEFDDEDPGDLTQRPPVITVMGHVDHGKTLLLDRIRETNVVEGEAGGITQHVGAYQVEKNGRKITFIDTPGHEAFTAMRARGAQATDIVILMVAADDGVMPTTLEALDHARAADVPIVVAINKVDRENADPDKVRSQLAERDLVPEDWGGETIMVEISALERLGIDDLLEQLLIVSEVEELVANAAGRAQGVVVEANLDKGRGPVATILVQRGTLKVGDPLVAGAAWGRVRALINDRGENVTEAGPSTPVQVLGLSDVARAGDNFVVAPDEKTAARVADTREHWQRQVAIANQGAPTPSGGAKLEDLFKQIQAGEQANLNLIVKADVHGSLEATVESLRKLERDDVKLQFVSRGVGGVTENDVQLALASDATIIGFNVRPDRKARESAEVEGVEIRTYDIIYKLLDDIENAMLGLLEPEYEEVVTGDAEVREIFRVPRIGSIAGCYVTNGTITRGSKVRFLRDGVVIWKGAIQSLRRFKDDVREVAAGYECGIGLTDFQDLKSGDIIETFEEREIPRS